MQQRSLTCSLKTTACIPTEIYGDLDCNDSAYGSTFPVDLARLPTGREAALRDE